MQVFNFLRQTIHPAYLGVDIGTTTVKMVEVSQGKVFPKIDNYGILESRSSLTRANSVFQTSSLKLFDKDIVEILHMLVGKMKPKTREVVASLPGFSAFMTVVDFPAMNPADLSRALAFKAKEFIPLPISEVALDWLKVGEYVDDRGFKYDQILLISVPREQIKKYQDIFKSAGFILRALEIEPLSIVRSAIAGDPTPTLVIDIGSRSTAIIAAEQGELRFASQTDFASASLTQALASSLEINPLRAEELKRERGVLRGGPTEELSTIISPFLDAIINEVKRFERSYASQFVNAKKFERILLAGGGSNLLGLEKYISDSFGIPAAKAAPFMKFEYDNKIE
ncbi:MAG: type IV pilus assembly protein PilM, partial [Candidatus Liptonbacteria bacterium]